jgi:hypothetical protein
MIMTDQCDKKERHRNMDEQELKGFNDEHPYLKKLDKNDIRRLTTDIIMMMMKMSIGDHKDENIFALQLTRYMSSL